MRIVGILVIGIVSVPGVSCLSGRPSEEKMHRLPNWTVSFGDSRVDNVLVADDRVLVRVGGTRLVSLDAATGRTLWDRTVQAPLQAPTMNMRSFWTPRQADASQATLVRDHRHFITGSDNRDVIAVEDSTGKVLWRYRINVRSLASGAPPVLLLDQQRSDPTVYVLVSDIASQEQRILMIDSRTGVRQRELEIPWDTSNFQGRAVIANGTLYMTRSKLHGLFSSFDSGTTDGSLAALDVKTGKELWCSPWRFEQLDTPVVYRDMIFVSTWGEYKYSSMLQAFRATRAAP